MTIESHTRGLKVFFMHTFTFFSYRLDWHEKLLHNPLSDFCKDPSSTSTYLSRASSSATSNIQSSCPATA